MLPADPDPHALPDPIPRSYYPRLASRPRWRWALPGGRPQWRWALPAGRLPWQWVAAGAAGLAGAVCLLLTPWRPGLALLGLVAIAIAALAADVRGLRSRVPLLNSSDPRRAAGGWAALAALFAATALVVVPARGAPGAEPVAGRPSPARTAVPTPTSIPVAATPSPTPSPTRRPTPTATPRPTPTPITLTISSQTVQRSERVTLRAQAAPNTVCTAAVGYPSPPTLSPSTSDNSGRVSWSWRVGSVPAGTYPITVTCGGVTATTQITVSEG